MLVNHMTGSQLIQFVLSPESSVSKYYSIIKLLPTKIAKNLERIFLNFARGHGRLTRA